MEELLVERSGEAKHVKGIRTADGTTHLADVTIFACGGWTPGVIPELESILETTAGSVVTIQLPGDRRDLWDKVHQR